MLPAVAGFGLPEFVTFKSACVPEATAILTVAELLAGFVSRELVEAVTVLVMIVPASVPAFTR